jgi:metallo-beta-lactamase family protein
MLNYQSFRAGSQLIQGAQELKIYGKYYLVKAQIHALESLSAHGDQSDLLSWMGEIKNVPERVFFVHGESEPQKALAQEITSKYGWQVSLPVFNQVEKFFSLVFWGASRQLFVK